MNSHGRKISATRKKLLALGVEADAIKEACRGTAILLVEAREHIVAQDQVIADLRGELSMREESFEQLRHVCRDRDLKVASVREERDSAQQDILQLRILLVEAKKRITVLEAEDHDAVKLRRRLFKKSREMEDLRQQFAALKGDVDQVRRNEDMAINFTRPYVPSAGEAGR